MGELESCIPGDGVEERLLPLKEARRILRGVIKLVARVGTGEPVPLQLLRGDLAGRKGRDFDHRMMTGSRRTTRP